MGSPNQGGGNQRNMEVYNVDAPAGVASAAGILAGPAEAQVVAGSQSSVSIGHSGGNQGVFINDVELTGPDAGDFEITSLISDPFLMPVGGDRELGVEYDGQET